MTLHGDCDEWQRHLTWKNTRESQWAKHLIGGLAEQGISLFDFLKMDIIIHGVRCGSIIIDYSLETSDSRLMQLAVFNLDASVGSDVASGLINDSNMTFTVSSNAISSLSPTAPPSISIQSENACHDQMVVRITGCSHNNALNGNYPFYECHDGLSRYKMEDKEMYIHFGNQGWEISRSIHIDIGYAYCDQTELSQCVEDTWNVEEHENADSVAYRVDSGMTAEIADVEPESAPSVMIIVAISAAAVLCVVCSIAVIILNCFMLEKEGTRKRKGQTKREKRGHKRTHKKERKRGHKKKHKKRQ